MLQSPTKFLWRTSGLSPEKMMKIMHILESKRPGDRRGRLFASQQHLLCRLQGSGVDKLFQRMPEPTFEPPRQRPRAEPHRLGQFRNPNPRRRGCFQHVEQRSERPHQTGPRRHSATYFRRQQPPDCTHGRAFQRPVPFRLPMLAEQTRQSRTVQFQQPFFAVEYPMQTLVRRTEMKEHQRRPRRISGLKRTLFRQQIKHFRTKPIGPAVHPNSSALPEKQKQSVERRRGMFERNLRRLIPAPPNPEIALQPDPRVAKRHFQIRRAQQMPQVLRLPLRVDPMDWFRTCQKITLFLWIISVYKCNFIQYNHNTTIPVRQKNNVRGDHHDFLPR